MTAKPKYNVEPIKHGMFRVVFESDRAMTFFKELGHWYVAWGQQRVDGEWREADLPPCFTPKPELIEALDAALDPIHEVVTGSTNEPTTSEDEKKTPPENPRERGTA